jgi:uncharacterized protein (DUF1330 family)
MPIEPTESQIKSFVTSEISGPIVMLNLLRFKPSGGRESYGRYADGVGPILDDIGAEIVFYGDAHAVVIGEEGEWDVVVLVRYPSKDAFVEMIRLPEYQAITGLRAEALLDSRLVCLSAG